jgi:hypothetical protein
MQRKRSKGISALIASVVLAMFTLPASAMAASTTVSPAGDSFALGSSSVNLDVGVAGVGGRCTMSGGTGTVPASPGNHNASGPVAIKLTANPKFSNCHWGPLGGSYTSSMQVFPHGVWALSLQAGSPSNAKLEIPASGLTIVYSSLCEGENHAAASWSGKWTNGTLSPFVSSSMALAGSLKVAWQHTAFCTWSEAGFPVEVSGASLSVSDTTNPAKLISVGS